MCLGVKAASLLIKIDVADKTNLKKYLGFGMKYELEKLIDSKKVINRQVFQF